MMWLLWILVGMLYITAWLVLPILLKKIGFEKEDCYMTTAVVLIPLLWPLIILFILQGIFAAHSYWMDNVEPIQVDASDKQELLVPYMGEE